MEPHWDDVRIFLAVARHESLSAAGRVLKIDPATVGRRVSRLESAFGVPLFVKSPQGYALSEAGERFLEHGEAAEQAMRAATETLDRQSEGMTGQMRIGAPDGCANYLLPQVCARLGRENPDLDIQIVALPRVVNLSRREADMAIAVSAPSAGQLLVKKITDYKLHLVASQRYLRNSPALETVEDLRGRRMVGYIPDMIFDAELDYLDRLGVERVPLASNSVPVQLRLLCQDAGFGIAHDFSLPAHRTLCKVLSDRISLTRSFYLVRHQGDQRSQRLNRFSEALASGVRDEVMRLEAMI